MIKNRKELLRNIPPARRIRRRILLDIVDAALRGILPSKLLKKEIIKKNLTAFKRIVLISIGKAGAPMAKAILPLLKRKPDKILIANVGHPLPTLKGVKITKEIIKTAKSLTKDDLAIVLISGGGSAMLVAPAHGITLGDKIKITKELLKSGATINEMNVIRKHLSQVKGGRLASLLYPATVWGFVISDVVGNDLSTIASGPLSPDPSTLKDSLKILEKYRIKSPGKVLKYLKLGEETPKPGEKFFKKVTLKIIGDHGTVVKKAFEQAKKMGLKTKTINSPITGEAREVARAVIARSRSDEAISSRYDILIASGETTVTCRGNGQGGRNQEFVLSGLRFLKPNQTLLSIGTDGVDGICPENIAGAIADTETLRRAKIKRIGPNKYLNNNDSYNFFKKAGGLIKTGPTGTNLGDLMMIIS